MKLLKFNATYRFQYIFRKYGAGLKITTIIFVCFIYQSAFFSCFLNFKISNKYQINIYPAVKSC